MALDTERPSAMSWDLAGFDCHRPYPDVVIFQPNRKRSRAPAGVLVFISVFFSLFGLPAVFTFLCMIGVITPSSSNLSTLSPSGYAAYLVITGGWTLATCVVVVGPMVLLAHDEILHRLTPITIDRRSGHLLYGTQTLCRLEDIECLVLRKMIPTEAKHLPTYGVVARLRSGRRIPRIGVRGIIFRYCLGQQEEGAVDVLHAVADFIGAGFELKAEKQDYGGGRGHMAGG